MNSEIIPVSGPHVIVIAESSVLLTLAPDISLLLQKNPDLVLAIPDAVKFEALHNPGSTRASALLVNQGNRVQIDPTGMAELVKESERTHPPRALWSPDIGVTLGYLATWNTRPERPGGATPVVSDRVLDYCVTLIEDSPEWLSWISLSRFIAARHPEIYDLALSYFPQMHCP